MGLAGSENNRLGAQCKAGNGFSCVQPGKREGGFLVSQAVVVRQCPRRLMLNNASLFLGLRYLQPKRSFVSIITIISVIGIMLGVAVLIVVISVMKGFEMDFKKLLLGNEPHVLLVQDPPLEGEPQDENSRWQKVLPQVQKLPGVISAAPYAAGKVLMTTDHASSGSLIYGLPAKGAEAMKAKLIRQLLPAMEGEPSGRVELEDDEIVINEQIASDLEVGIGDEITLLSAGNVPEFVSAIGKVKTAKSDQEKQKIVDNVVDGLVTPKVKVAGILRNGDPTWACCYVPLHIATELFHLGGRVSGIGLELSDAHTARQFADSLLNSGLLPPDWGTNTWMDRNQPRLAAIQNERVMMWFVMSFVVLVAAFSVATTTLTVTVQKRREIGILTALGSRVSQITGVFMTQAVVVALLGTVLGYIGGTLFLHYRNAIRDGLADYFNVQIFPKDIYFLAEIPAMTQPMDVAIICVVSVVLCLLAAFLPAFFAARVDPAVALRD